MPAFLDQNADSADSVGFLRAWRECYLVHTNGIASWRMLLLPVKGLGRSGLA